MKKMSLLMITAVILMLARAECVFADAVYLKNGTVMTGRIVEKTPEYIVLKTDEEEDAVRVTVFLEDVYKIEEQEQFVESLKFIPYDLLHNAAKEGVYSSDGGGLDNMARIKNLLVKDRSYQATLVEERMESAENIAMMSPQERQRFLERLAASKEAQDKKLKDQQVQNLQESAKKGDGSISGSVILPDLPYSKRKKGDLYVYLMEDLGGGKFYFNKNMLYIKVGYRNIVSRKVDYKIEHVPEGRYKVFAQWDIESPFIKEKIVGVNEKVLGYLGAKGDYSGSYYGIVDLKADEVRPGVDFSCSDLIFADQYVIDLTKEPRVEVEDLYYQKLPLQEGKIILLVKNDNDGYINLAAFDILINDQKVLPLPFELVGVAPHSEKEFDIMSVYRLYINKGMGRPGEPIAIKIVWPPTEEVVFEKVVQVL